MSLLGLLPLDTGGDVYVPPSADDFNLPPLIPGVPWFDKYMLQAILGTIVVIVFWLVMARKRDLVPSKSQYLGEYAYFFVRNSIARDNVGHEYRRFLPWLIALFSFILVNNLWGVFPLTLMPTTAHAGWTYGLAAMVWIIYNAVGIAKHGFFGYLRRATLPAGVPIAMWALIIPLEFFSNIIVRPITLALRLFANMFAGHLLVLVFVIGGEYLLFHGGSVINTVAGGASLVFSMPIFALELFVQCLQAFIFTVLAAVYLASSLAEEH